ncbi:TetR/AcrR family transcriptional regulator [Streptomyces albireticuli]|uniref:TetR family transcriptional regulator n=1 Tax=Streptomyces albireticuli TaxID=1940 RepID=A0A2A2D6X5_9ACTN|nr:TetR/AcrR family transcriptional regulator [Streptomyces albireticuli]MCD9143185.1 TetR/AcrR family transcriptional regulator [Streptomyces albireticuli]MCD9163627.1 TetR/AcrR family transcriptional regulator [Streptomyces albireticuli]MCD9191302.1 TetR/AcrR family transcriptional regulator [Streptomyces albireticuli]PAU47261.1 TetR family transcriptional regulator [Streptomyces albireticuli]
MNNSQQRGTERSRSRRAELIAIGRKLFADTSYDALSMDDIARHAGVAKGLIYYYFTSKRGYYLAIIEDSVAELVLRAGATHDLPPAARVEHTVDGYLRYAQHHQAAYRAIVTGGVGFDAEVMAIREGVRERLLVTIAQGAWGRPDLPPVARTALIGWLSSVEGVTLDWLSHQGGREALSRETVRSLLVRGLGDTLRLIEDYEPTCPAPSRSP